ncbi:putative membrane protein [[Clostridium] sordellii ATCC 9714]|nr:putative membrane protein [[Clostridium] sordellii ATCC 9714] [Paeniclostridium sordellii ATCC 9714]
MEKVNKILPGLIVSTIIGFISIFLSKFVPVWAQQLFLYSLV